ncbi:Serum paraoxonase/arylesterase 2 [Entomortierella beljakovae]|nr:Serum paraoxonase/arylesterase 2 [Entomortierella beljakovae]
MTTKNSNAKVASGSPTLGTKNFLKIGLTATVLLGALSYDFINNAVIDLGLNLGTIQPFNIQGCELVKGLETCEDIHIHHNSGLAFTTCGHALPRKGWYPPIGHRDASNPDSFKGEFVIYNIETGKHDVVDLVGLPEGTDRVFHGLDIFERSPTEITLFLVNHRRTGSVIEVVEYTIGSKTAQYKETVKHDLITTPNDIVALGPRSFYVSNDHHYLTGVMRSVEEYLRRPWSNVVYYSPEDTFVAFEGVISANGMTANPDRSLVFLSGCHGAGVHVLAPNKDMTLSQQDYLKLDFYNDNPSYDPSTGDVFVTGHAKPLMMLKDLGTPGKSVVGPSKIVRLRKNPLAGSPDNTKYIVETVLLDDGSTISTGTVAAVDRKRGVMLVGSAFSEKGFVRCPIPQGA